MLVYCVTATPDDPDGSKLIAAFLHRHRTVFVTGQKKPVEGRNPVPAMSCCHAACTLSCDIGGVRPWWCKTAFSPVWRRAACASMSLSSGRHCSPPDPSPVALRHEEIAAQFVFHAPLPAAEMAHLHQARSRSGTPCALGDDFYTRPGQRISSSMSGQKRSMFLPPSNTY